MVVALLVEMVVKIVPQLLHVLNAHLVQLEMVVELVLALLELIYPLHLQEFNACNVIQIVHNVKSLLEYVRDAKMVLSPLIILVYAKLVSMQPLTMYTVIIA